MEHLSEKDLAEFVDTVCGPADRLRIRNHLHECGQCRDAYRDALRALGTPVPDEFSRLPRAVVSRATGIARKSRAPRSPSRWRLGTAAAVAVLLSAVVLLLWIGNGQDAFDPRAPELAQITESLIQNRGSLLLPGTEAHLPDSTHAYRSISGAGDTETARALDRLLDRFRNEETSPDETYWLAAGYTSMGDAGLAREVIEASRRRSLDDPRFLCLEAVHAYRTNNLDEAVQKLKQAVKEAPRSPEIQYNLGVVLRELGREEEARRHLDLARKYAKGPVIRGHE